MHSTNTHVTENNNNYYSTDIHESPTSSRVVIGLIDF